MRLGWFFDHGIGLMGPLFLLAYGLLAILRPGIVSWVQKAYPGRELDTPAAHSFTKVLGAMVSAFAALRGASHAEKPFPSSRCMSQSEIALRSAPSGN
jgi:hypothetical protein